MQGPKGDTGPAGPETVYTMAEYTGLDDTHTSEKTYNLLKDGSRAGSFIEIPKHGVYLNGSGATFFSETRLSTISCMYGKRLYRVNPTVTGKLKSLVYLSESDGSRHVIDNYLVDGSNTDPATITVSPDISDLRYIYLLTLFGSGYTGYQRSKLYVLVGSGSTITITKSDASTYTTDKIFLYGRVCSTPPILASEYPYCFELTPIKFGGDTMVTIGAGTYSLKSLG